MTEQDKLNLAVTRRMYEGDEVERASLHDFFTDGLK
jgi:hypothetical protein